MSECESYIYEVSDEGVTDPNGQFWDLEILEFFVNMIKEKRREVQAATTNPTTGTSRAIGTNSR